MTTLDISELTVAYGRFRAVDGVSLQVAAGQCYALVGESGCGKTTLARTVTGLLEPASGEVRVEGTRIDRVRGRDARALRRRIQIVFQNPYAALNPRMSVARLVGEPLRLARPELSGAARTEAALELLGSVGLGERFLERRPHELSGGQCQRVAIARALAMDPALLVLDEPTSALDVSVQAQVLNLLADLRARRGLAYLLISHDLGVVRHLADRIGVMRAGRLVEEGGTRQVLTEPAAAYTRTLIAAIPGRGRAALLAGAEPAPPDPDPDPAPDPAPAAARAPATGPAGGPAVSPAQIEPNTGSST